MREKLRHWAADAILLLARGSLGLFFLVAGLQKVVFEGMSGWLERFNRLEPWWLSSYVATPYAIVLPFVEVVVGTLVLVGLCTNRAAEVMTILVATFIVGTTGVLDTNYPFHPNVLILCMALLISATGPGEWSVDELLEKGPV